MSAVDAPILGRMLRPLTAHLREELLQAVAAMRSDDSDEARYHQLADKNAEGVITIEERQELEAIVNANTLLSTLQEEARRTLADRR